MFQSFPQFVEAFKSTVASTSFHSELSRFGDKFGFEFQIFPDRFMVQSDGPQFAVPLTSFRNGESRAFDRFAAFFRFENGAFELFDVRSFGEAGFAFFGPDFFREPAPFKQFA